MGKHKYGAKRTVCQSEHSHPSKAEAVRCDELRLWKTGRVIGGYESQPDRVNLSGNDKVPIWYRPDFYVWGSGTAWYEEVKGAATEKRSDWRMKAKLWRLHGPCELRVRGCKYGANPQTFEMRRIQGE